MTSFWIGIIEQGLIFAVMALGIYVTYKVLDFPDLSVDGSFPLGAAVTATCLVRGINPFVASFISLGAGMLAGAITGVLHVKLKITNLLSGILVMIGLYSVNLRIMGRANIPFFTERSIFHTSLPRPIMILSFLFAVKLLLDLFLKTKLGFVLRAVGDNPQMVTSLGIDIGWIKIMGLMLSNGIVALSGSMLAQYQGFSDIGMGSGIIVMGLASIILGEAIFKRFFSKKSTFMALGGALLYQMTVAIALRVGLPPTDLKFITAAIVTVALGMNNSCFSIHFKNIFHRGGERNATGAGSRESFQ